MRKDKLTRLERGTRAAREQEELKAVFMAYMAQVHAVCAGEEPPPAHPRAAELAAGTFMAGSRIVTVGLPDGEPLPDLSEE